MTQQPRIKGQEFVMVLIENNQPLPGMIDVRSFEMSALFTTTQEGYLGETTDRYDFLYHGFEGRVEVHFENRQIIDFTRRQIDKARRRTPGTRVNLQGTLNFPGGDRVRMVLKDLNFDAIPLGFGSRADYGAITLPFKGSDYQVI